MSETDTPKKSERKLSLGKTGGESASAGEKRKLSLGSSSRNNATVEVRRSRTIKPSDKKSSGGGSLSLSRGGNKTGANKENAVSATSNMVSDNPLAGLTEHERKIRLQALEQAQTRQPANAEQEERAPAQRKVPSHGIVSAGPSKAVNKIENKTDSKATGKTLSAKKPQTQEPESETAVDPAEVQAKLEQEQRKNQEQGGGSGKDRDYRDRVDSDDGDDGQMEMERATRRHKTPSRGKGEPKRREGKLTITRALEEEDDDAVERGRSLAALKRAREKEKMRSRNAGRAEKVFRDVIIPESISVADLANRMAERGGDVVKALIKMGVMVSINQTIDGDTAEIIASEFGHRPKRVNEAAVEDVLTLNEVQEKAPEVPRPPVVTIMGHVDHGKTSLLDAYRESNVVSGEAGGITQHIGAYRVKTADGFQITFLDTPGHAAFTAMRQRGAGVTDIVILVVAADDGIMPQTAEAISHAKAAEVPIIVAINKMDKQGADPERIRQELLTHELISETMGGDVQTIEVSALKRQNLDKLLEAVQLQAEIIELTAPKASHARGSVVEAKQVVGRGAVATVLVQSGTLSVGDIFVSGQEWGRVKAMLNESGERVKTALPADPVEVLGFQNVPVAGDEFIVLSNEVKAREVADYRREKHRERELGATAQGSLEQMFAKIKEGEAKELPVVVKADVQGSLEAIAHSLEKLSTDEVKVKILHASVGAISESDVSLAAASDGVVFGFNVRANPQARDQAKREGIDIRYYSIIYMIVDDVTQMLSGMLSPDIQEKILGYAEIREVFNISKIGKIAGCYITDGEVRRGAKVRLLRDNTVIYEGALKQLKRHKEDVREVKNGYECGMALENYDDLKVGDQIECFTFEENERTLG